ncbi:MAG TPA: single-stranded-DNA-specific exonuclease RecJ [Kiritimatiellia bacterium]|nr:single-stranded-DNA-specific exonuclease RecJ [Kiritimatiellia bacterium]HRZ11838.1 single-stranded-DNA-specific exonuclease RecJ [Kiritimatiellia bacterium]HSA17356.1 single-stranded-DNA-specific exonuclease RecJ [Kiritimatiellia bacterium]
MPKLWKTVERVGREADPLAASLGIPRPLAEVLATRGLAEPVEARRFLNPRLDDLSDPTVLPDMPRAVDRIRRAAKGRERIAVFGDYDADGVTAAALLTRCLRELGAEAEPFLPLRLEEGYGLGVDALNRCLEAHRPQLVITVDCGTGSVDAVRAAAAAGVDVVVTDHHEPAGEIAPAIAVVNPKLGDGGDLANLAGVGVAFKLAWALALRSGVDIRRIFRRLDLVATGTVADVVPLTGENRILVHYGLGQLNREPLPGLAALAEAAEVKDAIGEYHLGFAIGPRLNAAGRLGDAQAALELLLGDDPEALLPLARQLDRGNRERQKIEADILEEAMQDVAALDLENNAGLVLARRGWHPGVIGIVASRIVQRFGRPVLMISLNEDGTGRGSGRSIEGFNLVENLAACRDSLVRFGGHAMAAGLELKEKNLAAFREAFNRRVSETVPPDQLRPVQRVDAWLDLADADERLFEGLQALRPFGCGNPRPVWASSRVRVLGQPRILKDKHLKMRVVSGSAQREAIGFNLAGQPLPDGPMDIAFTLDMNSYMGRETLQLKLEDFRPSP